MAGMDQSLRHAAEYIGAHKDPATVDVVMYSQVKEEPLRLNDWCGKGFTFDKVRHCHTARISSGELAHKLALAYFQAEDEHRRKVHELEYQLAITTRQLTHATRGIWDLKNPMPETRVDNY